MCLVVNKNYKSEKNYSLSFSSLRRDVQISHLIKKKIQQYEQILLQVKGYKKHLFLYQFFFLTGTKHRSDYFIRKSEELVNTT